MSRKVFITTPENVALEFELAGIGTRFAANLFDTFIQILVLSSISIVLVVLNVLVAFTKVKLLIAIFAFFTKFVAIIASSGALLIFFGYYIYFELRWNGQTPGKRRYALRVMREGGYPVTAYSVILRNLLRLIDFLPGGYGIGILSLFLNNNYQRLGDLVAGTIVIKQRTPDRYRSLDNLLRAARITPEHLDKEALALVARQADLLTPDEYLALRHFTERRRDLGWDESQVAAMKIAVPLMQRLAIVPPASAPYVNYADFLEYMAVAYELARRPK